MGESKKNRSFVAYTGREGRRNFERAFRKMCMEYTKGRTLTENELKKIDEDVAKLHIPPGIYKIST